MSKRLAGEPLERLEPRQDSPHSPKRVRVDDAEEDMYPPPAPPEEDDHEAEVDRPEDEDEEGVDESADAVVERVGQQGPAEGFSDLYLDTIDRCVSATPPRTLRPRCANWL